jgi:hypothetical protein
MSAFYERCTYCSAWVLNDEMGPDGSCLECQGYDCMRCHASGAEWGSNLCLLCVESLEVSPLLALVGQGVSVQLEDERLCGVAYGTWLHKGELKLVLDAGDVHDDGTIRYRWLPLREIERIELCVRDALDGDRTTDEFHAWKERESQAEALFHEARATTVNRLAARGAGAGERDCGEDEEPCEGADDDDCADELDATPAAGRAASEPSEEEASQMMGTLLATLDALALQPWRPEGSAPDERHPGSHGLLAKLRLMRLLRHVLPEGRGRDER